MAMTTRTIIGPNDRGRRMAFDDFIEAEFEGGYLYELARGVIDVTEVPGHNHGRTVRRLARMFIFYDEAHPGVIDYGAGGGECRIRVSTLHSDRHPDQAIYLQPPPDVPKRVWQRWVPAIVVEIVSVGGEDRDFKEKAEEYLTFGVQEYWILDPTDRTLHVHRRANDAWVITVLADTAIYQTPLLPGLEVHPGELLGPAI
jgi:Uma2 family endonuclease